MFRCRGDSSGDVAWATCRARYEGLDSAMRRRAVTGGVGGQCNAEVQKTLVALQRFREREESADERCSGPTQIVVRELLDADRWRQLDGPTWNSG